MPDADRVPAGVDPSKPNGARIFNYLLGGKDNYEVDQMVAHRMLAVDPATRTLAWFSRRFLLNAVEMAAAQGIRQFIDIGAGIPLSPNVHEVAQKIEPTARVVSVDYDPVVHAHANALLVGAPGVTSMLADVRAPVELIVRLRSEHLIDFAQPVAVLMVGVLHFVMDDEQPYGIVAHFRDVMAPGSLLAYTQAGSTTAPEFMKRTGMDTDNSPAQVAYRTQEQAARFLDGFEVVKPGVAPIQQWLGDDLPETKLVLFGGVGRIPDNS